MPEQLKTCFVIGPIGPTDSDIRRDADFLRDGIIKPAIGPDALGYQVKRADDFPEPGMITTQVILAIRDADLVVADLSNHNPNAFYEIAVRHAAARPIIHMVSDEWRIPFDMADYRAIQYSIKD